MTTAAQTFAPEKPAMRWAALSALGVVYGDLGTSPLYTLQTVVEATGGRFTAESALGVLSLIVWTLLITVSVKYCLFVMRADNHGEGGILALMSLVGANGFTGWGKPLAMVGLLGAALIYGDGVITPAISVLSALEGVNAVTDTLKPYVMPASVAVLVTLFALQRYGTARIGGTFGPIMLTWFVVIAGLGLTGIARNPVVLSALNPMLGLSYLARSHGLGLLVLGGCFLCITGAEALYADMGHFGAGPIRLSWFVVVLPALLFSYAGQTGLLIERGVVHGNPFFQLAPSWAVYPLVILATIATIIASQAIITGSFSMTRQAMQLGWLPGVRIRQTSDRVYGQIYVPVVNWLMMIFTIAIVVTFGSSNRLAGAYGTAVSTTMLLTTCLLFVAMLKIWRWPMWIATLVFGAFFVVDATYFSANLLKIGDGGWLPLSLGVAIFLIMLTWRWGIDGVRQSRSNTAGSPQKFAAALNANRVPRVPGTAIFLTRTYQQIPPLLTEHIQHMGALQQAVIAVNVIFEETPRVANKQRCAVEALAPGIWRVTIRFGFIEIPDITAALRRVKSLDKSIDLNHAIYFATRDLVVPRPGASLLSRLRLPIFAFLYRNAVRAVDRFSLPPAQVVEVGRQIEV